MAAEAIEQGRWVPEDVLAAELPARFGHVMSPQRAEPSRHEQTAAPKPTARGWHRKKPR